MDAVLLAAGLGTRLAAHLDHAENRSAGARPAVLDSTPWSCRSPWIGSWWWRHCLPDESNDTSPPNTIEEWAWFRIPARTGNTLRKIRSVCSRDKFLVINGDDLFGAEDFAKLAACPAGVLVHRVESTQEVRHRFYVPDGSLEKLVEKPPNYNRLANLARRCSSSRARSSRSRLPCRRAANTRSRITSASWQQCSRSTWCSTFWFPIGTEDAWTAAQKMDLQAVLTATEPEA